MHESMKVTIDTTGVGLILFQLIILLFYVSFVITDFDKNIGILNTFSYRLTHEHEVS